VNNMFVEVGQVVRFNLSGKVVIGVIEIILFEHDLVRILLKDNDFVLMRPDYLIGGNSYCHFCNHNIPISDDGLFIHDNVYHG